MNHQAQLAAAQQLAAQSGGGVPTLEKSGAGGEGDDDIPELEETVDDGPVDETGIDPKDIDLVIQQVGCSRAKAVKALKESGGDLINASTCFHFHDHDNAFSEPVPDSHGGERVVTKIVHLDICIPPPCFTVYHQFIATIYLQYIDYQRIIENHTCYNSPFLPGSQLNIVI
jgi:NACalpha-BTF3-like transcription factor